MPRSHGVSSRANSSRCHGRRVRRATTPYTLILVPVESTLFRHKPRPHTVMLRSRSHAQVMPVHAMQPRRAPCLSINAGYSEQHKCRTEGAPSKAATRRHVHAPAMPEPVLTGITNGQYVVISPQALSLLSRRFLPPLPPGMPASIFITMASRGRQRMSRWGRVTVIAAARRY